VVWGFVVCVLRCVMMFGLLSGGAWCLWGCCLWFWGFLGLVLVLLFLCCWCVFLLFYVGSVVLCVCVIVVLVGLWVCLGCLVRSLLRVWLFICCLGLDWWGGWCLWMSRCCCWCSGWCWCVLVGISWELYRMLLLCWWGWFLVSWIVWVLLWCWGFDVMGLIVIWWFLGRLWFVCCRVVCVMWGWLFLLCRWWCGCWFVWCF